MSTTIEHSMRRHGVGVRELARRLDVSPSAITAYKRSEREGKIGVDTLDKVLGAMGETAVIEARPRQSTVNPRPVAPFRRREDRVSYELHRAIAHKLIQDRDSVMAKVPVQTQRMRAHARGGATRLLDEWDDLVDAPVGRIIETLLGEDEHSKDLRQMSPFIGVLTQDERVTAIERARLA